MDPKKDSSGCRSLPGAVADAFPVDAMDDHASERSVSYEPSLGDGQVVGQFPYEEELDLFDAVGAESQTSDFGFERVGDADGLNAIQSAPEPTAQTSEPSVITGNEWNTMLSHAFATSSNFTQNLLFPWETGTMREIFCDLVVPPLTPALGDTTDLSLLSEGVEQRTSVHSLATFDAETQPAYLHAVRSLKDVDYIDGKKAQLTLASSKWMELLSINWRASSVGEQICQDLQYDPTGDAAEQSLKAVFGVKSPTTLLKRAASLRQYVTWFQRKCVMSDTFICPLPLMEQDVWSYFLHLRCLRRDASKGYTVSSTFLETIRFCKFVLGLYNCDDILGSKRLTGFAAVERREKGPLRQAPSLEVEHLVKLHQVLENGSNVVDRIGAGAFLCAIYARARWSDLRYIHHIRYDGFQRNSTMDLYTAEHKTSSAGLRREQFLPLVIPSEGIVAGDWIGTYIELCHMEGFDWHRVPFGPLLSAPRAEGGWCARPLSTSEAAEWLRRLLSGCNNVSNIRAHSLKTTLCIWAARAGFSKEHRATLSHHASALHGSDIVYSRELQSGAIRKLQMLLKKIRIGLDPTSESAKVDVVTAPFEASHVSAVRTPVLNAQVPSTPLPPVDELQKKDQQATMESTVGTRNLSAAAGQIQCKQEDFHQMCIDACDELNPFGAELHGQGLIEIDSSSGSDSNSDSSSSEDESSSEHFSNALPKPVYTEHVPEGMDFVVHKKSKILHKCQSGSETTICKTRVTANFFTTDRIVHFKYPKCMRCFVKDSNRLKTCEQLAAHLDETSKRRKCAGP